MGRLCSFALARNCFHRLIAIFFMLQSSGSRSRARANGLRCALRFPHRCELLSALPPRLQSLIRFELTLRSRPTYNQSHMRRTFIFLILLAGWLCAYICSHAQQRQPPAQQAPTPAPAQPQEPVQRSGQTIRSTVNLVDVLFTVLNRRNKLVPELDKNDFKIFDDNVPQEIRYFSKQTDLPLRIGMLLDTSNSIRARLEFEQDAATNFLFSVLRRGHDEAFVMTFDDEPQVLQGFTEDAGRLRDQITKTRAGGGTAVYDAIYNACANELSHPPRPPGDQPDIVRRVMVLISDGEDNLSTHTRSEAIEMAQRTSVVIYTISTSTQWIALSQTDPSKNPNRKYHLTPGAQILQSLADETGGRSFY